MKSKEEAIKMAYEEIGLPFNDNLKFNNGWLKIKPTQFSSKYEFCDVLKMTNYVHSIRPKSLSGIENNNEWVLLNDTNELPNEDCYIFYNSEVHILRHNVKNKIIRLILDTGNVITHYQPIIKPKPPIY